MKWSQKLIHSFKSYYWIILEMFIQNMGTFDWNCCVNIIDNDFCMSKFVEFRTKFRKKRDFNLMKIKITNGIRDEKCRVLFKLIELFKIIWHLKIQTIFDSKSFRVHFWECGHQHEIPHKIFPDILSQYSSHSWYRWSVDVSYTKAEKPPTQKLTRIFFVLLKLLYINP